MLTENECRFILRLYASKLHKDYRLMFCNKATAKRARSASETGEAIDLFINDDGFVEERTGENI